MLKLGLFLSVLREELTDECSLLPRNEYFPNELLLSWLTLERLERKLLLYVSSSHPSACLR